MEIKRAAVGPLLFFLLGLVLGLEFGTGCYEGFTSFVAFKFLEVVDEALSEVLCFDVPVFDVGVSVAGIEDFGIYAGELGGHFEVEQRNSLSRSVVDRAVEDSVDDTAGVFDGDTFASTVPASVYEISFSAVGLHFLNEFFAVFCGVKRKECSAEAS